MNSLNNTVLITGAAGFLGGELKAFLLGNGYTVITLGRKNADIICDLSNSIPKLPSNIDFVIHAAGKAHMVPKTEQESADFFKVNVNGTQNLLKGITESHSKLKSFVFISSVAVYGVSIGKGIDESNQLLAEDPYGKSKIEAELIINNYCESQNILCTILRLPLIAGKNPPGNLGAMISAIKKGMYFSFGNGLVKKSMVLASDVAEFMPTFFKNKGIYNLTDGYHPTFHELETAISRGLGKNGKIKKIPGFVANLMGKCGDLLGKKAPINTLKLKKMQSELTFSDQKARKELQWNPHGVLTCIDSIVK